MSTSGGGAPARAPLAITGPAPATPGDRGGGRRPAAPTVNPRSVTDFEDVAGVPFVFARHPICHEVDVHMNGICSDAFMDVDDLFAVTAPPSRTAFVADPVAIVKTKIQDDFVVPNAVDTPDPTSIAPLWARCSFSISTGHRHSDRRLALATLREAMQHAVAHDLTHELKINHCWPSSIALPAWIKLPTMENRCHRFDSWFWSSTSSSSSSSSGCTCCSSRSSAANTS